MHPCDVMHVDYFWLERLVRLPCVKTVVVSIVESRRIDETSANKQLVSTFDRHEREFPDIVERAFKYGDTRKPFLLSEFVVCLQNNLISPRTSNRSHSRSCYERPEERFESADKQPSAG